MLKAIHAFSDMIIQIEGMDGGHQEQRLLLYLTELAKRKQRG